MKLRSGRNPMRINRLKETTDRLYKKLGVPNSRMLFHAQHATLNTILGRQYIDDIKDIFGK